MIKGIAALGLVSLLSLSGSSNDSDSDCDKDCNLVRSDDLQVFADQYIVDDEEANSRGAFACGPLALGYVVYGLKGEFLDHNRVQKARNNGGGLGRNFLSIFSKKARDITWPGELEDAFREEGFKVKSIKWGNKLDKADRLLAERGDVAVIARIEVKGFFDQHYTNYIGGDRYYDLKDSARGYKVREIFVVSLD